MLARPFGEFWNAKSNVRRIAKQAFFARRQMNLLLLLPHRSSAICTCCSLRNRVTTESDAQLGNAHAFPILSMISRNCACSSIELWPVTLAFLPHGPTNASHKHFAPDDGTAFSNHSPLAIFLTPPIRLFMRAINRAVTYQPRPTSPLGH